MAGLLAQPLRSGTAAAAVLPSTSMRAPSAVAARTAAPVVHALNASQARTYAIDEQTLSAQANSWLAGQTVAQTPLGAAKLDGISVQLRDGEIEATATANTGLVAMPVQLVATPEIQAGRVIVHVTEAHVGNMTVPDGMRQSIEQAAQSQLDQTLISGGVSVESVTIDQGQLIVVAGSH